jgi:voltage-gated potassium channel
VKIKKDKKVQSPPPKLTRAQERYDDIAMVPIYIAALAWFVATYFRISPALRPEYGDEGERISWYVTAVFLIDVLIRFLLDPDKRHFLRRNWFLIVCIVVPVLRIFVVISAIRRIRRDRNAITKMVFLYALYGVLFVITIGAALVLAAEIDGTGSIRSYGDAVWWSLETVTTVGYGDFTPVTVLGRVMAGVIMFSGAAAVGALTAAVASRFIKNSNESAAQAPQAPQIPPATSDDLQQAIATLTAQIQELNRRLEREGE